MHVNEKGEGDWLRSYDGYLRCSGLTGSSRARIIDLAHSAGIGIEFGIGYLELSYVGRDRQEFFVAFLRDLATLMGNVDGEIRCEVSGEQADPTFEFFRIVDGRLLRQRGRIVRGELEEVPG